MSTPIIFNNPDPLPTSRHTFVIEVITHSEIDDFVKRSLERMIMAGGQLMIPMAFRIRSVEYMGEVSGNEPTTPGTVPLISDEEIEETIHGNERG